MLDEIAFYLDISKLNDLRARLENKRVEQALPAEIELGVLWALSTLGELDVEPEWYGDSRPDAYTEHLFEGIPCIVEITAMSDGRLSQEDDMRRVSTRLCEAANKIRKGQGKHLFFQFLEISGYTETGYVRRRQIDRDFVVSEAIADQLRTWLTQKSDRQPIQIQQGGTCVVVSWHAIPRGQHSNFFSSMPAEMYSLEENPLYETLKVKSQQLVSPAFEGLRCVVVGDVGARMLRHPNDSMRTHSTVTGQQVIEHFLSEASGAVDVVLCISPFRKNFSLAFHREPIRWCASLYARPGLQMPEVGINKMMAALPPARFEGYQARSLHQQAAFRHDTRGWYVGTSCSTSSGRSRVTIKISARALLDLLAGRITVEQFQHFTGLDERQGQCNIFKHRLEQGDILTDVKIEHGGLDEDDDWLVIELRQDPAAALLKINKQ